MAVGLYQYDGSINNKDSKLLLSENIASQQFYKKYWEKAIEELHIKYLQDGAEFDRSKEKAVLEELKLLYDWADNNLQGKDLEYMQGRIKNLQEIIPIAFKVKNTILYIF